MKKKTLTEIDEMTPAELREQAAKNKRKGGRWVIALVIFLVLLIAAAVGAYFYCKNLVQDPLVYQGVSWAGEDFSGFNKQQVQARVERILDEHIGGGIVHISADGETYQITPALYEEAYSLDHIVEAICSYNRQGEFLDRVREVFRLRKEGVQIQGDFTYDEGVIAHEIRNIATRFSRRVVESTYEAASKKVTLVKGTYGRELDESDLLRRVNEEIRTFRFDDIEAVVTKTEPAELPFEEIEALAYQAPVNACYGKKGEDVFKVPEKEGWRLDVQTLKDAVAKAEYGASVEGSFLSVPAEVTQADLLPPEFKDILSDYYTELDRKDPNRTHNVELAASKIHGTILLPGEEFSYNKVVGKRTYAAGFRDGAILTGGELVDGVGGGICHVSSTIYPAVLLADLEIVERKNHACWVPYSPFGHDATVYWGSIDFRFKNNRETPVMILCWGEEDTLHCQILGIKTNDYTYSLSTTTSKVVKYSTVTKYSDKYAEGTSRVTQNGRDGNTTKVYLVVTDAQGNEVEKRQVNTTVYKPLSKIVTVGTKKSAS
ncbi:MAG: VanW family protein [Clostridia bacterium]|nr:VanW family protein [Clostridia bacterium]